MVRMRKLLAGGGQPMVNYNYTDIAAGTGFVNYYAGTVSGANILSNNTFSSNNILTNCGLCASTAFTLLLDEDYDLFLNNPLNVRGDAIVEVPCGNIHALSAVKTAGIFINAKIRKWDGTTETEIVAGSSPVWNMGWAAAGNSYNMRTARIRIPTTHFKAGEYLRLSVLVYAREGEVGNSTIIIGHDPVDRRIADETYANLFASGSSILKLQLPLKMDT